MEEEVHVFRGDLPGNRMAKWCAPLVMAEVTEREETWGNKISNLAWTINTETFTHTHTHPPALCSHPPSRGRSFLRGEADLQSVSNLSTLMGLGPWLSQPCVEFNGSLQEPSPPTRPTQSKPQNVQHPKCWGQHERCTALARASAS